MDYPKSVPSVGLVNGKFVDENPVTGQVGSLISSDWGNAVTDELLNVIRAGGKEPAEAEHDQLLAAIKAIVRDSIPPEKIRTTLAEYGITDAYTKSVTYTKAEIEALLKNMSALPVGAMVPFPKGTVPTGFLEVDGSVQSAATYPDLAAYLGTTFNTGGEGAGNFRLPESRGEFLRGWDHGRGVDTGRTIGSGQMDALQNITGESSTFPTGNTAPLNSSGVFKTNARSGVPTGIAGGGAWSSASIDFDASRVARAAAETRPRNLAVMWCIKAWNAPINQGNIDVAALAAAVAVATPTHYLAGLTMSLSVASTSSVDVAPGHARGTGNPVILKGPMSAVIQSSGSWTEGNGSNKLDTGGRAANTWYHLFIMRKLVGGEADLLFSASLGSAIVPTGFEIVRRIGSVKTDNLGRIIPFINLGRRFIWVSPIKDASGVLLNAASSTTLTLTVPPEVRTLARVDGGFTGAGTTMYLRPTDGTPQAISYVTSNSAAALAAWGVGPSINTSDVDLGAFSFEVLTDTAAAVVMQTHNAGGGFYSITNLGYTEF